MHSTPLCQFRTSPAAAFAEQISSGNMALVTVLVRGSPFARSTTGCGIALVAVSASHALLRSSRLVSGL
jgi:hypothetical protein